MSEFTMLRRKIIGHLPDLYGPKIPPYETRSHRHLMLKGLNSLRQDQALVDVELIAEEEVFPAHKAVLAACTDYFKAMFSENMVESKQREIKLIGIDARGLRIVLDYIYTSILVLDNDNVESVLSAASHLQIWVVVERCSHYLASRIDIENCVDIATIADIYSLQYLKESVFTFMCLHLHTFSKSDDFQRMRVDQIEDLLKYDFPVDCSELDVLEIILAWFNFSLEARHKYAERLMPYINFSEISLYDLVHRSYSRINDNNVYKCSIHTVLKKERDKQVIAKPYKAPSIWNTRGFDLAILKIGGFCNRGMTNDISYRLADSEKWKLLTSIPHVEQCNYGVTVFRNELYVIGGCCSVSLMDNMHAFGFKFSPFKNKWSALKPMSFEKSGFSLNTIGNLLYAAGGSEEVSGEYDSLICSSRCEAYDPDVDQWTDILPMPEARMHHAGTGYESGSKKYLFISGGTNNYAVVNTLFRFDINANSWSECEPMLSNRSDHVVLIIDHYLYACGGWGGDQRARQLSNTIDRYEIATDTWVTITQIPTPRFHAGIVNVGYKIYVIGGFLQDMNFYKESAPIECYNIESNSWSTFDTYPQGIWEHYCATLYIPKYRYRNDYELKKE